MAKKKKEIINLLPQEEFAASTLGRILTWLLSTFRMIVIATEMVVMGAFLSRFWLDARNTDLNDEIKQKSAIISSYKEIESTFRSTQTKLAVFSSLTSTPTDNSFVRAVTDNLPADIVLSAIIFTNKDLKINGAATSEQAVAQLITNLQSQKSFKNVGLTQLESDKAGNGILFSISTETTGGTQ